MEKVILTLGEVTSKTFSFSLEIKDGDSYFYGLQTKKSFEYAMEEGEIIDALYYGTPVSSPLSYNGQIFGFQEEFNKDDLRLDPGQDYILWIAVYDETGMYTDEDIYTLEINMPSFTAGGSINVESTLDEVSYTSMRFNLSAQGAQFIYWMIISTEDLYDYPYEEDKIRLLLNPESRVNRIDGGKDIAPATGLRPGVNYTLVALAIDSSGNYGELHEESVYTDELPYNSLTVEIDENLEGGILAWNVTGGDAVKYRYYLERTDLNSWVDTCGEDYTYVQEQMYLQPAFYRYHTTTETSIPVELESGIEYVFIVVAVDENDNISLADHWIFTY